MGDLKFDPFAADIGPVLAPIELKRLARLEHQGHIGSAPCCLFRPVPIGTPSAGKGRNPSVRPIITELHQINMHLLHGATFFARLPCLRQQPG